MNRKAALQRRQSLVYDGNPPPEDYGIDDTTEPSKNPESPPLRL